MEHIQKSTLTLKTTHLNINTSNAKGTVNEYQTKMTWNNINFRLLLGDMYDKFDNFNLKLVYIACDDDRLYNAGAYVPTAGIDNSDRIVSINLSGLNMLNNTYDTFTNNIGTSAVIATYNFYESFSKEFNNSIVTFTKGNDVCNLTIEYKDILNDTPPATLNAYPQMVFVFHIYGIPREKK